MVSSLPRPTLPIQLTSLQPPETVDTLPEGSFAHHLLLIPGKPSEMVVKLENTSDSPWQWQLEIKGDFPLDWSCWHQAEIESIAPQQTLYKTLPFCIPNNFFEQQNALSDKQTQLNLNYQAQVYVYAQEISSEPQLVGYKTFNLFVRPTSTYLDFLPAFYGETDFMGRFLSIFEQAFDPTVQATDTLWAYLDPLTAPKSLLPFLAHWVALDLDERWDIKQQRRLIRNAIEMYRWQGTRRGLRWYLHLYTGLALDENLPESEKQISIEEVFNQGFIMGKTRMGEDSMLGGGRPYHFIVRLRPRATQHIDEELVREIIEREKPAFCSYELFVMQNNSST